MSEKVWWFLKYWYLRARRQRPGDCDAVDGASRVLGRRALPPPDEPADQAAYEAAGALHKADARGVVYHAPTAAAVSIGCTQLARQPSLEEGVAPLPGPGLFLKKN